MRTFDHALIGVVCLVITGVAAGGNIANPESPDWIGWMMLGFPVIIAGWHLMWLYTLSQLLDSNKELIDAQKEQCVFLTERVNVQSELIDTCEEFFYFDWKLPSGYFTPEKIREIKKRLDRKVEQGIYVRPVDLTPLLPFEE